MLHGLLLQSLEAHIIETRWREEQIRPNKMEYIIIEPSEVTPLLYGKQNKDKQTSHKGFYISIFIIVFIFFGGLMIAGYLLFLETRYPKISFVLDLIEREVWSSNKNTPKGDLLDHSKVKNVIIMQTYGKKCDITEKCVQLLKKLQEGYHEELPYNFLIGSNGEIFEAKGWDYPSSLAFIPKHTSIVLGMIGDFTYDEPTNQLIQAANSLILEGIRLKKLPKSHKIYSVQNLTVSRFDGQLLHDKVAKWNNYETVLHFL